VILGISVEIAVTGQEADTQVEQVSLLMANYAMNALEKTGSVIVENRINYFFIFLFFLIKNLRGMIMNKYNVQTKDIKNLEIYESYPDDSRFKKPGNLKYKNDIVKKILYKKTICLRCHNIHSIRYHECPDCGAETLYYDSDIYKNIINSKIKNLRVGIPGKIGHLYHKMQGSFRDELQLLNNLSMTMHIGYRKSEEDYSDFCPVNVWDLERMFLMGINFWNYLYSTNFGTFVKIMQVYLPTTVPLPKQSLKDYLKYPYFQFGGHHKASNKNVLILSRNNDVSIDGLIDLIKLEPTIKKTDKYIHITATNPLYDDFKDAEWYLYYNLEDYIIIVPQERTKLDIQALDDLETLVKLNNFSNNYKIKSSIREWDMDDEISSQAKKDK